MNTENVKTLLKKMLSRKFVIGASLIIIGVVLLAIGETETGKQIIIIGGAGYLGMEGIADLISRMPASIDKVVETINALAAVDTEEAAEGYNLSDDE